jgi:hypothetical protein
LAIKATKSRIPTIRCRNISSSPVDKNAPWHLGNTTVRTPYRLAGALRVLTTSDLNGHLGDEIAQVAFLRILHEEDVLARMDVDEATAAWNSRKWRSALYQLGFITPEIDRKIGDGSPDEAIVQVAQGMSGISGAQYEVTPNGQRLANAVTIAGQQDCFLRSILAYRVPSVIEAKTHRGRAPFSPLRVVLRTLASLEKAGAGAFIRFEEMASLVQFCKSERHVDDLVRAIIDYRHARQASEKKKRVFDAEYRDAALASNGFPVKSDSLTDYADVNFRYLKATGLLSGQGAAIAVADGKWPLIDEILAQIDLELDSGSYLRRLWDGATLPTDEAGEAASAIRTLLGELHGLGWAGLSPLIDGLNPAALDQLRLMLVEERRVIKERGYGLEQRERIDEIIELLSIMDDRTARKLTYRSEAPAYLEWTFWRAFLAIDTLINEPWDVRQFQVGQDLLPLFTAASRRPDIVCEFQDWVLVVEVTLTESSRQEAMEGEPVRRHVADVSERHAATTGKPVLGLFVAPSIDPNTAETFGRGTWVYPDGRRVRVDIVPITIQQFRDMFRGAFGAAAGLGPVAVRSFLNRALACRCDNGQAWKRLIAEQVGATAPLNSMSL